MIRLENVSKYYPTPKGRKYALRDVNLELDSKVNIGVLGLNGAGKSTLLRLMGGIDFPNKGKIFVDGSISWPLGLSGGIQGSLTGRENAQFVCRVHGDSESVIRKKLEYINDFAELGEYFDLPVKSYSSGMRGRLQFGVSMAFDFDIYLIDEITAVGDARFREKSRQALLDKRETSKFIMVSHNVNELIRDSDVLLVLNQGEVDFYSDVDEGLAYYNTLVKATKNKVA